MSPPTTPRARRNPPTSYPQSTRLAAAPATTTKSTFAYEHDGDRDLDDEYDLTYTSKHVPRASMVDNLVMSLDHFSNISTKSTSEEEDRSYRPRGHTFSSSVSSDSDLHVRTSGPGTTQSAGLAKRNSLKYSRDPVRLPSIYGEDEDSIRTRVYEAQRADFFRHKTRSNNATPLAGTGVDSTKELDLSHLRHLQGKLGPAGNRRSQSFDFGSQTRPAESELYADSSATAMTPQSTTVSVPRRNSARSIPTSQNKPSTAGTRFGVTASQTSATASTGKPTASISDATRPGLFKRFFGSSSSRSGAGSNPPYAPSSLNTADRQSSDHGQSQNTYAESISSARGPRPTRKPSLEANNKENIHPLHSKKSTSSFFRRRKKSIAVTSAVPLPLTLQHMSNGSTNPDQGSPVSSLKAFMDPYLAGEGSGRDTARTLTSPLQKFYTPPPEQEKSIPAREGEALKRVDSTTDTDETIRDAHGVEQDSRSFHSQTTASASNALAAGEKSRHMGPRAASSNAVHPTIRPVIETRSTSLTNTLNIPARKESLLALDTTHHSSTSTHPPGKSSNITPQNKSVSDVSNYQSAPSTPVRQHTPESKDTKSPSIHVSHPSVSQASDPAEVEHAKKLFDNGEELIDSHTAAEWLGEAGSDRERVRNLYMGLFDWTGHNILNALRSLCSRLALRAESQLIDRILDAFAQRWCQCNPTHGFRSADVVHTICYSILLLNTDLHMADIGSKMTRNQFVKNSMQTIRPVAADASLHAGNPGSNQFLAVKQTSWGSNRPSIEKDGRAASAMGQRPGELARTISEDAHAAQLGGPLVEIPFSGSDAGWEVQIEGVLKEFYYSIQREPLPLFGRDPILVPKDNNLLSLSSLRRTPSMLSRAQAETGRGFNSVNSKTLGNKWSARTRSRPRLGSTPGYGSSKTSLEDQSSGWSPSISSTWSKGSLGKTLASMSVDSLGTEVSRSGVDQPASVGFASALSQAIIREDQFEIGSDDGMKNVLLLEDESLELEGAPWAKEGILKHKCHLDEMEKKYKDRTWNDCFAVIEKGWMRLFSFSTTAKSLRARTRSSSHGAVVGGGNWQDNAEEVWKFMLRHTIASALPPPGYSKARPHVFALQLHTGSIHLFSAGTADIVKEFVSTANFWSARLSKEPMIGGVSSMEYGWSDAILSQAGSAETSHGSISSGMDVPRPSTQMSIRSSIDQGGPRARLPGDRIYVSEWQPPQTSMFASQLTEVDQRKALETYVKNTEADHQIHNDLRSAMLLAFSPKHPNYARAMSNWERKSQYMLTEIVKFKGYIESLQSAQAAKERVYKTRKEEDENKMNQLDSMAFHNTTMVS